MVTEFMTRIIGHGEEKGKCGICGQGFAAPDQQLQFMRKKRQKYEGQAAVSPEEQKERVRQKSEARRAPGWPHAPPADSASSWARPAAPSRGPAPLPPRRDSSRASCTARATRCAAPRSSRPSTAPRRSSRWRRCSRRHRPSAARCGLRCISAASPLHLRCICAASPLHLRCISAASAVCCISTRTCISATSPLWSPLHLRCPSAATAAAQLETERHTLEDLKQKERDVQDLRSDVEMLRVWHQEYNKTRYDVESQSGMQSGMYGVPTRTKAQVTEGTDQPSPQ